MSVRRELGHRGFLPPRLVFIPATAALLATALVASAASGQPIPGESCAPEVTGGTTFHFEEEPGDPIPTGVCFATGFRCTKPEDNGEPTYHVLDAGCDPVAGPCRIQVRVPLKFPGNEDNIDDGLNTMEVRWYFQSTASPCSDPVQCGQVSTCGKAFTGTPTIDTDRATFTATRSLSCSDIRNTSQPLSLTAWTCITSSSCKKRLDVNGLDLDGPEVAADIGCPTPPPKDDCENCTSCPIRGVPGDGRGPRIGGGELGAGGGAYLYYAAGGVGHPQYPGTAGHNVALGRYWSHDYAERIVLDPDETHVWLLTRRGTFREWSAPDGSGVYTAVSPSSEKRILTWLGAGAGWSLAELDGTVHLFDASGLWLSSTDRNGNAKTAVYGGGELLSVEFPDERREDFTYHPDGKLASITEVGVDGLTERVWEYTWGGDVLTRVDRPDGTALVFSYGDGSLPGYLTRIELEGTDDTSVRVLRAYEYAPQGRVTKTWRGDVSATGPDAVEVWSLALDDPDEPTVATVTDPLGAVSTYTLGRDTASSNVKVLSIEGDCPVCGLGPSAQLSYDDPDHPMLPTRIIDARGTWTEFEYDGFGQVTRRIDAANDPDDHPDLPRETVWQYHPDFRTSPTLIQGPFPLGGIVTREVETVYDPLTGDAETRTIRGLESTYPTGSFELTTDPEHNAAGMLLTIDPPGHGTADATSFTYDPARGALIADTRTDPLVGTTAFGHDALNRRTSVTDPNGVVTTTAYDLLDRVTEIRQEGASPPTDDLVTTHTYTVFRDLFQTFLPEGNVIEYDYDAAGRLVSIERKPDAATHGERVFYTLNETGNRTFEELQRWDTEILPAGWVTVASTELVYTNRCQVDRIVQAPGTPEEAVTVFSYDCNGNLELQWDPNHDSEVDPPTTSYAYDALDRLTSVSQPWNPPGGGGGLANTSYGYDVQDHLTSVTDAEGNVTTYVYSDRDLLTQEVSPVSGTTAHEYDEHGELVETTDARGVTVIRGVDELDRVTAVDYPDDALDTTYTYDAEPVVCAGASFELGRLGAITRNGEAVEYCYDRFGRTTRDGELTYAYDANGNRTGIGYPGGVSAAYAFDYADREESLEVFTPAGGAVPEPVVSAASYLPSGPLSTLFLGSGTTETRGFDGRYVPTAIVLTGPVPRTFTYQSDEVGNVLEVVEQAGCTPGPLVLEDQTVTTEELFVSCTTIEAGNGFAVESPGEVTFQAQGTIALKVGFSVGAGAFFTAGAGGLPEISRRTYGYQAPQYFLTRADGPWGEFDWTYDRIGNRLTESRDGGVTQDGYVYATNPAPGNTPILDLVNLAVGGTRDYTWGAAGHLEEVAAGANVLDFGADAEGRLSGVNRTAAGETAAFTYDGRSFLQSAHETVGGTGLGEPLYDSAGLLHALRRRPSPADPEELIVHFYLAGRPVAQLAIDGAGTETWTYLTTDHLGTPLLATDDAGAVTWEGGFEPFGRDYQQGTPAGALESGVFLRLPGQWEDGTGTDATSGAEIYYNVHRWYQPGSGRYLRPDPLAAAGADDSRFLLRSADQLYGYANGRPTLLIDPLGLQVEICQRPNAIPQLEGTPLDDWPHQWIRTPQGEAGAGPAGGVRREDRQGCPVCRSMVVTDHSNEPVRECREVLFVDEDCVNRLLEIGRPIGGFFPLLNDCGAFVRRVIGECRQNPGLPPYRHSPLD